MNSFIEKVTESVHPSPIVLQSGGQGGSLLDLLFPMAAIMLIFYLLLIRPQQRKQKEHEKMLKSVGKGDRIVTSGGIHGEVTGTSEDLLTVEIGNIKGERVRVRVDRSRVERRVEKAKDPEE